MVSNRIPSVQSYLCNHSVFVPDDWLRQCIQFLLEGVLPPNAPSDAELNDAVYYQWLYADLRELKRAVLPSELEKSRKMILTGSYTVQINSVLDISQSYYSQYQKLTGNYSENVKVSANKAEEEIKHNRMLYLELTDGVTTVKGMEYQLISSISIDTEPGAKVQLIGPIEFRNGCLLLTNQNIAFLGGAVDILLETNTVPKILSRRLDQPEPKLNPALRKVDDGLLGDVSNAAVAAEFDDDDDIALLCAAEQAEQQMSLEPDNIENVDVSNQLMSTSRAPTDSPDSIIELLSQPAGLSQQNDNFYQQTIDDTTDNACANIESFHDDFYDDQFDDFVIDLVEKETTSTNTSLPKAKIAELRRFNTFRELQRFQNTIREEATVAVKVSRVVSKNSKLRCRSEECGGGWNMTVQIEDSMQDLMDVELSNELLQRLIGYNASDARRIRDVGNNEEKRLFGDVFQRFQALLAQFSGVMDLKINELSKSNYFADETSFDVVIDMHDGNKQ